MDVILPGDSAFLRQAGLEPSTPVAPRLRLSKHYDRQLLPFGYQPREFDLREVEKLPAPPLDGCNQTQTVASEVKPNNPPQ